MKRTFLYLVICLSFSTSFAQSVKQENLGTKTLYQPMQAKYSAVPVGYKPVYINYLGRHGARHLTKDVLQSTAFKTIAIADSLHVLTTEGKKLKQMILKLSKIEENHVASISVTGAQELEGIAKRLYSNQQNVFNATQTPLLVATTKKGRTKESAEAFLAGLKKENVKTAETVKFNYADDDHLRFYDFSKTYDDFKESGTWLQEYKKLTIAKNLPALADKFASKFFSEKYLNKWRNTDKVDFTEDIYGFYTILQAVQSEAANVGVHSNEVDFKSLFSKTQLEDLKILGDAEDFLTKGPGTNNNGIQVRIAAPLLADFINTTDDYLKDNKPYVANLRFAHAETVAPFAAFMDIQGASEASKDILTFNRQWQAENVIPFSANIQWIVYKNSSTGKYLVKFLLNEKEVAIRNLKTSTFPYYSWDTVRALYLKKLESVGFKLNGNAHEYLLNVK